MAVPIRPEDLPPIPGGTVAADANIIIDDGDGVWKATPLQVLQGAGGVTSAVLAASGGSDLSGFIQSGTGSLARTVQGRLRDTMSLADKGTTADMLTALQDVAADLATGGTCTVPRGTWTLSGTFTFAGDRLILQGSGGPYGTTISFNPASADVALEFNSGTAGGVPQSEICNFGFTSANSVAKTAIKYVNVPACSISNVGISSSAWLGALSEGIRLEGRDTTTIQFSTIGTSFPLVIGPNATFPANVADHLRVHDSEFVSTSATGAAIKGENNVCWSNTSFDRLALVGGLNAFEHEYTTIPAASVALSFRDGRTEQGLSSSGHSFTIGRFAGASTLDADLQAVLWSNYVLGGERNGIRTRNIQRHTLVNVQYSGGAATGVAFSFDGVPGGFVTMIGCMAPSTATASFAKMRSVFKVLPFETGSPVGPFELWQYFNPTLTAGVDDYTVMQAVSEGAIGSLGGIKRWVFPYQFPVGTRTLTLPGCNTSSMLVDVILEARAALGRMVIRFKTDATIDVIEFDGIFADAATGGKIYPSLSGAQLRLLGDTLVGATLVHVEIKE